MNIHTSTQAESNSDLARKLKLDQSYVARAIRPTSLAPDLADTAGAVASLPTI